MSDVMPLKGGWVLITRRLPTRIQVPVFSLFYAVPEKAFPEGALSDPWPIAKHPTKEHDLLYRRRQKAKLSEDEDAQLDRWIRRERDREEESDDWDGPDLELRVRIQTPDGEVCVEPHEYSWVKDIDPWLDMIGDEVKMHEMGGLEKASKLQEQMFYCMSRGITKLEAYKMLLGTINRPNVFWLSLPEHYAAYFGRAA